jgi:hypothetical protein
MAERERYQPRPLRFLVPQTIRRLHTDHRNARRSPPGSISGRWRRGRDSNPRALSGQRFSRPPPSTARPPLRTFSVSTAVPTARSNASRQYRLRLVPVLELNGGCRCSKGHSARASYPWVFKTAAFDRSATSPVQMSGLRCRRAQDSRRRGWAQTMRRVVSPVSSARRAPTNRARTP